MRITTSKLTRREKVKKTCRFFNLGKKFPAKINFISVIVCIYVFILIENIFFRKMHFVYEKTSKATLHKYGFIILEYSFTNTYAFHLF